MIDRPDSCEFLKPHVHYTGPLTFILIDSLNYERLKLYLYKLYFCALRFVQRSKCTIMCWRCTDQIAIPEFASGAMENWGLVTYRETNLLYKKHVSSPADQQRIASVVAHELAHMVGDLHHHHHQRTFVVRLLLSKITT